MSIQTVVRRSTLLVSSVACLFLGMPSSAQAPAALTGRVSSAAEGAMEGVLVSLKREGATKTVTVVSHADGTLRVPARPARARPLRSVDSRGEIHAR